MTNLMLYRLMVVMIGSLLTVTSFSQVQLQIVLSKEDVKHDAKELRLKSSFKSRTELITYTNRIPSLLQAKGFLSASLDSISESDNNIVAFVFLGKQYQWQLLKTKEVDKPLLEKLGYSTFSIVDASTIDRLPERIMRYYEDNGYPFARVRWDSIELNDNNITAALVIDKGPLYKMDSIVIYGSVKISKSFLTHYLNLHEEGWYNRSAFEAIDQKLLELPYLQQTQPWDISMLSTGYVLNFYLQPKRSNQVDALIGFLPSNQQKGGKLLLTVDAKLILRNAFARGETIDFNWEQIQPKSPRLNLVFQHPFIFGSRFETDVSFQLYKKDSSFLNIIGGIGLQYDLKEHQSMRVLMQLQRTNLLDIDTLAIRQSKQLPDISDVSLVNFGLEYSYIKTDYRINPRKGSDLLISVTAGKKAIRRSNTISQLKDGSFNYNSLYDSLQLNSYQLRSIINAAQYFPLSKTATLKTAIQGGLLQTPNYFRNELFQLGGYRSLRGFDEESIFASHYTIGTIEYRYLLDLNSYFYGFTDFGWSRFKSELTSFSHSYIGLGAGMAFETKQGIFNIGYAIGKRNDLRFDFRQSKIHFGYMSFF